MKNKSVSVMMLLILLLTVIPMALRFESAHAIPTVWHVYWPASIQSAINAAGPGDTIIVHNGTYTYLESLYINKSLTIEAGQASKPIIQGSGTFTTNYRGSPWTRTAVIFVVNSTNVVINGFDVEGLGPSQDGVVYVYSSGQIMNCIISGNTIGDMSSVDVEARASDLNITSCTIKNFGRIGVYMANCTGGVYGSTIIGQVYSDENLVNYGIEIENHQGVRGILEIIGNTIYNCDNTFSPEPSWSSAAIIIDTWSEWEGPYPSSTVIMICNNIYNNYYGIEVCKNPLSFAHYNNIYKNRVYGVTSTPDYLGINATFNARYNWWGNATGPYHSSNLGGLGNPVSDHISFRPWLLAIKVPPLVHDVGVKSITATPNMIEPGDMVHICVTVKNYGNTFENFTLTTNYGIYAKIEQIKDLAPGNELTFCYDWDTTGESTCYHTIDALASPVPGETNIRNNFRSTGVRIVSFIPPSATLKVEPSSAKGLVRGYFEVNVTINDLDVYWDLAGFDIKLCYNSTLLKAIEVRLGDFATRFNLTWVIVKEINHAEDYVYLSCLWDIVHLTPEERPHPYGSGTLFTIRFLVLAEGQGDLTFEFPSGFPLAAFPNATKWCSLMGWSEPIRCIIENGTVETMLPWKEDINADGKIDILDIVKACISYASRPGDPNWNLYADLNGDNVINILDIVTITRVYGLKYDP